MSRVFVAGETIKDPNGSDCEVLLTADHPNGLRKVVVYRAPDDSVCFISYQRAERLNPAP